MLSFDHLNAAGSNADVEQEETLDPQSQAKRMAQRLVTARSRGEDSLPKTWIAFGLELDDLELTEDAEAALDPQSRSALRAAQLLKRESQDKLTDAEIEAALDAR
eukprot:6609484-Prymnesium_polylepis.1